MLIFREISEGSHPCEGCIDLQEGFCAKTLLHHPRAPQTPERLPAELASPAFAGLGSNSGRRGIRLRRMFYERVVRRLVRCAADIRVGEE
jgi:hypothetical protein